MLRAQDISQEAKVCLDTASLLSSATLLSNEKGQRDLDSAEVRRRYCNSRNTIPSLDFIPLRYF